mgnify:CR=1 FL=1
MQSDGVSPTSPRKVVIFTTFSSADEAYSLNRVVIDQIKMLTQNGYKIKVIVAAPFEAKGEYLNPNVKIERIPIVSVHNEVKKDETFDADVTALEKSLTEILTGADVVITHDIIYQNACLKHNFAARKVAEKMPNLRWLHWIHSATSPVTLAALRDYFSDEYLQLVSKPFPNARYVFFNNWSVPRVAKNFGVEEKLVKVVHHPTDLYELLKISDPVRKIAEKYEFLKADVICVYPVRLDRGKQVEYMVKTIASMKRLDLTVKAIVIDFHSTAGDKVTYRDTLKQTAIDYGLSEGELLFTSQLRPEWSYETSHEVVGDFMRLSNVFIMPSVSESYSLITQEAGMNRCVVVANYDFPPFRDIFGPNVIYRKFSSNVDANSGQDGFTKTNYGGDVSEEQRPSEEKKYHYETGAMIKAKLNDGGPIALASFLRKERNLQAIFKKELEPLLYSD